VGGASFWGVLLQPGGSTGSGNSGNMGAVRSGRPRLRSPLATGCV
jgi:hypothetical protein